MGITGRIGLFPTWVNTGTSVGVKTRHFKKVIYIGKVDNMKMSKTVMVAVFALASKGNATQIEAILCVSHCPRKPRQVQPPSQTWAFSCGKLRQCKCHFVDTIQGHDNRVVLTALFIFASVTILQSKILFCHCKGVTLLKKNKQQKMWKCDSKMRAINSVIGNQTLPHRFQIN